LIYAEIAEASGQKPKTQIKRKQRDETLQQSMPALLRLLVAPPAPFSCSSSGPQMLANKRSNSELASKKGQKRARNPNASGARVFCRAKWTQQKRVSLPAQPH